MHIRVIKYVYTYVHVAKKTRQSKLDFKVGVQLNLQLQPL